MDTPRSFSHGSIESCFHDWITQQRTDTEELLESIIFTPNDETNLTLLFQTTINHFEQYYQARSVLAQRFAASFLSPSSTTAFENTFLWIGGFRPAVFIRLVYTLSGPEIGDQLSKILHVPGESNGKLREISQSQMELINVLYLKSVTEEKKLTFRMAGLQGLCRKTLQTRHQEVDEVLVAHGLALATLLTDMDHLRLTILKELIEILQAVNLLVASSHHS